ncbi:MAG: 50S ribosomal protein L24 [Acidiferrobacterales bacterium]|jgi:large subunit ribosomal protein L24|nr:50S ribosomal protein L24 [Acidiferrobacterales bacterium]
MNKIRKGDKIEVLAGKDKGKQGTVLEVREDNRVLVEGVNMVKKHVRPNPNVGETGGIVDREAALHLSNVALVNPATGKGERVGFKVLGDGKKVRVFRKSGEVADV